MYSGHLGDRHTSLGTQTLFSVVFQQKLVEVAINNFTMHLIISKWLRIQKGRQKRKKRYREIEAKEETVNGCIFIHLTTLKITLCVTPSALFTAITILQIYNLLFQFMNFLKIIHKQEFSVM